MNPSALPEPFDLATADQLSTERLALRVYGMPRVEEAIRQVDALFRSDPTALTRDGAATLEQVVRDVTFCAVTYAVSADPARPRILWTQTPPHSWHGFSVPGARYNLENPDNVYRLIQIDGRHRYRIAGCRYGAGPAQFLFELLDSAPGITGIGNQIDCLRRATANRAGWTFRHHRRTRGEDRGESLAIHTGDTGYLHPRCAQRLGAANRQQLAHRDDRRPDGACARPLRARAARGSVGAELRNFLAEFSDSHVRQDLAQRDQ